MQTRFLSTLLLAFMVMGMLASCSKKNELGRYIPSNASLVVQFNGKSVFEKLPWSEVKQNEIFKTVYNDTAMAGFMKAALDNPESTGIDINNDLVFFVQEDSAGGYAAIEGTVKDESKFKQFNLQAGKGATESEKEGIHYVSDSKMTSSWKKDKFVIVMSSPNMKAKNYPMPKFDSQGTVIPDTNQLAIPEVKRNLDADAASIFNLKEETSLAKEERFSDLLNTKGDIHFWINSEAIYKQSSMGSAALAMVNMNKLYDGSRMAATANFENGKIDIDAKSYSSKEMSDLWKKYQGDGISSEMASRIPSKNLAAYIALNFKPEGIKELIKVLGMEGLANMGAGYLGFNLDDFVKANKGDIMFALTDLHKDTAGKQAMNILFSTAIGDKASFGKLISAGKKIGQERFGNALNNSVFFNNNDQYFAIGNDKNSIDAYFGKEGSKPSFFDQISGKPMGGYVNLQYILNAAKESMSPTDDSLNRVALDASVKMWDNILMSGGQFSNGSFNSHLEVNLVDKSTNSLKQLNSYLGLLGGIAEQKKKANNTAWQHEWNDTTVAIPTPPSSGSKK